MVKDTFGTLFVRFVAHALIVAMVALVPAPTAWAENPLLDSLDRAIAEVRLDRLDPAPALAGGAEGAGPAECPGALAGAPALGSASPNAGNPEAACGAAAAIAPAAAQGSGGGGRVLLVLGLLAAVGVLIFAWGVVSGVTETTGEIPAAATE